ncbi:hypothetical protein [Corynebacterium durum]|uniref:hypothetical protein n=1 Tax=Corynebacterium durum TaxID=61592 RepID=UPI0028EBAAEE|nr:hypothetical protein [Corynebacterium durum]
MNSISKRTTAILDIFIIWHPSDHEGEKIFNRLLRHYHSEAFSGLVGGSIEVYGRSKIWKDDVPRPIFDENISPAMFNVIIPILGNHLDRAVSCESSPWFNYLNEICIMKENVKDGKKPNIYIFPIRIQNKNPKSSMLARISEIQGVYLPSKLFGDSNVDEEYNLYDEKLLERNVSQTIAQILDDLWTVENPLKIFVSHSKHLSKYEEQYSRNIVEIARRQIQDSYALEFFDAYSIQPGTEWRSVIEKKASRSALLVIRTDTYASRQWTQREVRIAKENDVPIVALSALTGGEDRGSFLLDNIPTVAYHAENFSSSGPHYQERMNKSGSKGFALCSVGRAISRLIDEALKRSIWRKASDMFMESNFDWAPTRSPEPLTITEWIKQHRKKDPEDRKLWIIHPDPPITHEEWRVLKDLCDLAYSEPELNILTPREFSARSGLISSKEEPMTMVASDVLFGAKVGVSISVPDDIECMGLSEQHVRFSIAEIARLTFIQGGVIIYGGRIFKDQNPNDLTMLLLNEAVRYKNAMRSQKEGRSHHLHDFVAFRNYFPWTSFIGADKMQLKDAQDMLGIDGEFFAVSPRGEVLSIEDAFAYRKQYESNPDHAIALTEMRKVIVNESDLRIVVGGKSKPSSKSIKIGVLEEVYLTLKAGKPVYISGAFGGVGYMLARKLGIIDSQAFPKYEDVHLSDEDKYIVEKIKGLWDPEQTGLNRNELMRLALSHRPAELMSLVLSGFANVKEGK